ncbi:MAG TPA: ATP-binding protein, partial [Segetibacter sp.]
MATKPSSIQRKLMRLVLVICAVVLVLTSAIFFGYEFYSFKEASRERLSTLGKIIASNSTGAVAFESQENAAEILRALEAEKQIIAGCIYDTSGNVFAKYPANLPGYKLPLHPATDGFQYVDEYLEGYTPIIEKNRRLGTLFLRADINIFYERLEQYGVIAILITVLSIFAAYLLSKELQKKISKPILALAKTAGNISSKHDYSIRVEKVDNDEVGILTDAFNQMLAQIEKQNTEITSFNHALELKVIERTNELEKANTELKLKSEFEETIINSSIDMIAVFDKEYKYTVLNKYGQQAFGVEAKDVIGKNILDVFPQLKSSVMYESLQKAFANGELIHTSAYKSYIVDKVMENYFIPLLDKDNNVYQVLVVGHDITEINKAHEKLKQVNIELEKSNLDLEQFAFVASHDLQEPLRKIQTFSQLLGLRLNDEEAAKKYLEKICSSADRMTQLIKAVLNYSRLSAEKRAFERVDLNQILLNIKNDYELTIAEKNAVINHGQLPVIEGNPLQLNQLMQNLISNSLKFCNRPPVITITSNIVSAGKAGSNQLDIEAGELVELVIKDNGIGFDQRYADKIFTVFQRLHSKQEYAGTGIGLALCKKIVVKHKGILFVHSTPGEGTTFTIQLPA